MTKIFTMVKDEVDIIEDWVLYHGSIFEFENLYVIDNFSSDGTYETLIELQNKYNINVKRLDNYKKKGLYMTYFLREHCRKEHAFPIDIDEFIVYYDKLTNTISCDKNVIIQYINSLASSSTYKMNYIMSKIIQDNGYAKATIEDVCGHYADYGDLAKTFFKSNLFNGVIDHGNHYPTDNYILTNLCLVHFHCRNLEQMKKKIYNNVHGLGFQPLNLQSLKQLLDVNPDIMGNHHIRHQINVLENTFAIHKQSCHPSDISLEPLNNFIHSLLLTNK